MRYQSATTTAFHKFYCGATLGYTISNVGGANLSDIRFKTNIQNITNSLDKINKLQGKSFYINNDITKQQVGFIAQDVIEIIPEVVIVDTTDENNYMYMQYDKLVPLLVESIKELTNRLIILENKTNRYKNRI